MALSRVNGFQASVRDMYPNMGASLTQMEMTTPETPELEIYGSSATASADTADGASIAITGGHKLSMLAVVVILLVLAVLFGYVQVPKVGA